MSEYKRIVKTSFEITVDGETDVLNADVTTTIDSLTHSTLNVAVTANIPADLLSWAAVQQPENRGFKRTDYGSWELTREAENQAEALSLLRNDIESLLSIHQTD